MKAFGLILVIASMLAVSNMVQTYRLNRAQEEIKSLTATVDVLKATQRADRETFAMQIKLVREASKNADNAHKDLAGKAGLSDADWLESVLAGMWRKDSDGGAVPAGVDAGAVRGAGSDAGTLTGKDASPVLGSNDTPRD